MILSASAINWQDTARPLFLSGHRRAKPQHGCSSGLSARNLLYRDVEDRFGGGGAVVTAKAILGPRQVACTRLRYEVRDDPADMLFEGAFGEMHTRDSSADPVKIAASVGFRGSSWKTLETGCGNEVNYHFIDPATVAFGLNNYIYTLKKQ